MRHARIGTWALSMLVLCAGTATSGVCHGFHYFEHRWLGSAACTQLQTGRPTACWVERPEAQRPANVFAAASVEWNIIDFGDLVAMAGDHFESPDEMLHALQAWSTGGGDATIGRIIAAREHQAMGVRGWCMNRPSCDTGVSVCAQVGAATLSAEQTCGEALLTQIKRSAAGVGQPAAANCYTPSAYDEAMFIAAPGYLTLASRDQDHFGYRAERSFRLHFIEANRLFLATKTWQVSLVDAAWVHAAFALHFYTDRFASGHIRTNPMRPVRDVHRRHWYDNHFGLELVSRLVVGFKAGASLVTAPMRWRGYGDQCLFSEQAEDHRAMALLGAWRALAGMIGTSQGIPAESLGIGYLDFPYTGSLTRSRNKRYVDTTDGPSAFSEANFATFEDEIDDINPGVPEAPTILETEMRVAAGGGLSIAQPRGATDYGGVGVLGFDYIINPLASAAERPLGFEGVFLGVRVNSDAGPSGRAGVDVAHMRATRLWSFGVSVFGTLAQRIGGGSSPHGGYGAALRFRAQPPGPYTVGASFDGTVYGPFRDVSWSSMTPTYRQFTLNLEFTTVISDGPHLVS
jgi:hypothetical protein